MDNISRLSISSSTLKYPLNIGFSTYTTELPSSRLIIALKICSSFKIRALPSVRAFQTHLNSSTFLTVAFATAYRRPYAMPKNPLRRLSVALGLTEAYKPVDTSITPVATSSLSHFLRNAKDNFLKDVLDPSKAAKWTVVMGNEAGDLDSIASSVAFAWLLSEVDKKPALPLIQIERGDLVLRPENLYALSLAGLSENLEELLTLTDISQFKPFPTAKFALVDHNRLGDTYTLENPNAEVIAVVDHHHDEGLHLDARPRIISPCGSCSSHIVSIIPPELPAQVATLLLTAILIDTDGLKPGGKAIQLDRDSALFLATKSTIADSIPPPSSLSPFNLLYEVGSIKDLTNTLQTKKADVSHLKAVDLLRRDYKESRYELSWIPNKPSIKAGLSSVPLHLKAWGSSGKLEEAAVEWMERRGITAIGILTSFHDDTNIFVGKSAKGKGKLKRQLAWIILEDPEIAKIGNNHLTTTILAQRLWDGLEADNNIKLKVNKKWKLDTGGRLPPNSKARVYKQGNAKTTRKVIAPLIKGILEDASSSSTQTGGTKNEGTSTN